MDQQITVQMQEMQNAGMSTGAIIFAVIVGLAFYVFFAYCLARIAKKENLPFQSSFIWALIPIANYFLMLKLGGKPWWWIFLFLIPIVNLVVLILLWMAIAERVGRPGWWGIMIALVPIANIIFFLMLVFSEEKHSGQITT